MIVGVWRIVLAALVLLCMVPVFNGCGHEGESNPVKYDPGVLMPLAVGNTWTYLKASIDLVENNIVFSDTYLEVTGDSSHGEETWHIAGGDGYINKPDGLHKNIYHIIGTIGPIIYRYPATSGESYTNPAIDGGSLQTTVVSLHYEVEAPAGIFNCVVYNSVDTYTEGFWSERLYFSPNIGLVFKELYHVRDPADTILYIREELTGFELH